jgi:prepilin peptidase CpaA
MPALFVLSFGLGAASIIDMRTRRIPNWLTAGIAAAGFGLAAGGGLVSPLEALGGLALGLALMMPGHLIGATGAGDVKLMAAVGAVVGPSLVVRAFVMTALAGGVLALAVAARRRRLGATVAGTSHILRAPRSAASSLASKPAASRFAYGPAIAAGSLAALLIR